MAIRKRFGLTLSVPGAWQHHNPALACAVWACTLAGACFAQRMPVPRAGAHAAVSARPTNRELVASAAPHTGAPSLSSPAATELFELPLVTAYAHVTVVAGKPVVLFDLPPDVALGKAQVRHEDNATAVVRRVPEALAHLYRGRTITVYSVAAERCEARLGEARALGLMRLHEQGDHDAGAQAIWEMAHHHASTYLAVTLDVTNCASAEYVWASAPHLGAQADEQTPVTSTEAEPALAALVAEALRALPEAELLAADYDVQVPEHTAAWDANADEHIQTFRIGGQRYVAANLTIDGSCGEWGAQLFGLWQVVEQRGGLRLVRRYADRQNHSLAFALAPTAAAALTSAHDEPPAGLSAAGAAGSAVPASATSHQLPFAFVTHSYFSIPSNREEYEGCGC